jgi:CO/xanthine dehydrogenase Mo-binding subunit
LKVDPIDAIGKGVSRELGQAFKPVNFLSGSYKIIFIEYTATLVNTNKNQPCAFCGAGTPPHMWALKMVVESIAGELGLS